MFFRHFLKMNDTSKSNRNASQLLTRIVDRCLRRDSRRSRTDSTSSSARPVVYALPPPDASLLKLDHIVTKTTRKSSRIDGTLDSVFDATVTNEIVLKSDFDSRTTQVHLMQENTPGSGFLTLRNSSNGILEVDEMRSPCGPSNVSDITLTAKDTAIRIASSKEESNIGGRDVPIRDTDSNSRPISPFSTQNNLAANIDQRYGGQYLTSEQLPEFCDQLAHLVEMIRNIQSYAALTAEYPSALEKRLAREAREVAALAAEVRNARDSVERARRQRKAVRAQRRDASSRLAALRDEEIRELESVVRTADRKLFKSWETVRDSVDLQSYDPLLSEVKVKQNALECLARLIDNRCATLQMLASTASLTPRALISPLSTSEHPRNRYFPTRRPYKRKRKEREPPPHSVPVSNEASLHSNVESNSGMRSSDLFGNANQASLNTAMFNQRSINSVISSQSPRSSIDMNPLTVPYELISQSGIPANMLPSMGSNSNHNLTLNVTGLNPVVPFRFGTLGTQPDIRVTTSDGDQAVGDIVFMRIDDH